MNNDSKGTIAKGYGYKHKNSANSTNTKSLWSSRLLALGPEDEPGSDSDFGHAEHPDAHRLGIYAGPECVPCDRATNRGRGTPVRIVDTSRFW